MDNMDEYDERSSDSMMISDILWFYWFTIQQLFTTMVYRKLDLATLSTAHQLYLLDHWTQHIPFHPAAGDADSSSFQHNGKWGVKYLFAKFTAPRCSLISHLLSLQCLYSPHLTSISPRRADWQNSPGVWAKSERWKKSYDHAKYFRVSRIVL